MLDFFRSIAQKGRLFRSQRRRRVLFLGSGGRIGRGREDEAEVERGREGEDRNQRRFKCNLDIVSKLASRSEVNVNCIEGNLCSAS